MKTGERDATMPNLLNAAEMGGEDYTPNRGNLSN
jgi:hypothetical protein